MTHLPQREELLAQFGGVPRVLERVVSGFLKAMPTQLSEIRQALKTADEKNLSRKAHSLKGSIGYFCQGDLYALVLNLESAAQVGDLAQAADLIPRIEEESQRLTTHLNSIIRSS